MRQCWWVMCGELVFVVLHQALHVPQLSVKFGLVVVDQVHLTSQPGHVGLEQGLHVGAAHPLTLQQLQLRLQHLILLLQETHLRVEDMNEHVIELRDNIKG